MRAYIIGKKIYNNENSLFWQELDLKFLLSIIKYIVIFLGEIFAMY